MAVDFKGVPFKLTKEDMGVPDYVGSLNRGLDLYGNTMKAGYLPRNLENQAVAQELANRIKQPYAENAGRAFEADVGGQEARTGLTNRQSEGLGIENQYLPEKLKLALKAEKFKQDNPLLNMPGAAGQIGSLLFLQQHPEMASNENQSFMNNPNKQGQNNYIDMLKNSLVGGNKYQSPYGKALNDYEAVKNRFGEGSPQEQQAALNLKNTAAKGSSQPLTNSVKTNLQTIITSVPKVKEGIKQLITMPSPVEIPGYRTNSRAAHEAKVAETAESYAKAKGWPNTNESIHQAMKILGRGTLETDAAYRQRLTKLSTELDHNVGQAKELLGNLNNSMGEPAQQQNEQSGVKFDPNNYEAPQSSIALFNDKGEMFFFPENQLERRLAEGYTYE